MFLLKKCFSLLYFCWFTGGAIVVQGQIPPEHPSLYFISDCQEPLPVEKIIRSAYNNDQGRETLFSEIRNKNEGCVFMLGDLVGNGSKDSDWKNVDSFLKDLHSRGTKVYAIPGNHEYLYRADAGIHNFQKRFPDLPLTGYRVRTDSMTIVMLNSNFSELSEEAVKSQQRWYLALMDSLDADASVQMIIVCTHHSPFSNSKVVGSSVKVQDAFVPRFESSPKAKLFITGHSHNLECFDGKHGKRFLVIGGGGGLDQPLYSGDSEKYKDLISQSVKPRFFYLVLQRRKAVLGVKVRGYSRDLLPVPEIKLSL